jgi:hypothetical protein
MQSGRNDLRTGDTTDRIAATYSASPVLSFSAQLTLIVRPCPGPNPISTDVPAKRALFRCEETARPSKKETQ